MHDIGAEVDYRMTSTRDGEDEDDRVYITPNGPAEQNILEYKFAKILGPVLENKCRELKAICPRSRTRTGL